MKIESDVRFVNDTWGEEGKWFHLSVAYLSEGRRKLDERSIGVSRRPDGTVKLSISSAVFDAHDKPTPVVSSLSLSQDEFVDFIAALQLMSEQDKPSK